MATTENNLKEAFAGESQANRKYLAFAAKASRRVSVMWPACFAPRPRLRRSIAHGHLAALDATAQRRRICAQPSTARLTSTRRCTHRCSSKPKQTITGPSACLAMRSRRRQSMPPLQIGPGSRPARQDLTETSFYLCPFAAHRARQSARRLPNLQDQGENSSRSDVKVRALVLLPDQVLGIDEEGKRQRGEHASKRERASN